MYVCFDVFTVHAMINKMTTDLHQISSHFCLEDKRAIVCKGFFLTNYDHQVNQCNVLKWQNHLPSFVKVRSLVSEMLPQASCFVCVTYSLQFFS